jgi:hypothetical protein
MNTSLKQQRSRLASRTAKADNRRRRYFFVRTSSSYGWDLVRERLRSPVPLLRYANLAMFPATTIGVVGRVTSPSKGLLIMRQTITAPQFNAGTPVAPGVYRTLRGKQTRPTYSLWNGKAWHWDEFSENAAREARYVSNFQQRAWAPVEIH